MALRVEIVAAAPRRESIAVVELPEGATVRDALVKARVSFDPRRIGIFGEAVDPDTRLADGDRLEIYRPLEMDPKEARRRRAKSARR